MPTMRTDPVACFARAKRRSQRLDKISQSRGLYDGGRRPALLFEKKTAQHRLLMMKPASGRPKEGPRSRIPGKRGGTKA
jgi:hypothetical protein